MQLYLYEMHDPDGDEHFYKVGVSKNAGQRFSFGTGKVLDSNLSLHDKLDRTFAGQKYLSDHPYETKLVHAVRFTFDGDAHIRERELLADLKHLQHWPKRSFAGKSECLQYSEAIGQQIVDFMKKAAQETRASEPSELMYRLAAAQVRQTDDPVTYHLRVLEKVRQLDGS